ncbi:Molecular chaperone (DnaJ superfamily) [Abeliophyllum distichum]|uniref:Molecular chaperone (DnaJ superfamily) n=1 Tax=Abeliophyllum distichum TaxID=126358 RepID=A0ABD1NNP5_9LAMI
MEYNNTKGSRRNKGGRRRRGRTQEEETIRGDVTEANGETEEQNGFEDDSHIEESTSHPIQESAIEGKGEDASERGHKLPKQAVNKKNTLKKSDASKSKVAPKGRKQEGRGIWFESLGTRKKSVRRRWVQALPKLKAAAKESCSVCEKCGEEFESRNKLHKHIGETGHASLKFG